MNSSVGVSWVVGSSPPRFPAPPLHRCGRDSRSSAPRPPANAAVMPLHAPPFASLSFLFGSWDAFCTISTHPANSLHTRHATHLTTPPVDLPSDTGTPHSTRSQPPPPSAALRPPATRLRTLSMARRMKTGPAAASARHQTLPCHATGAAAAQSSALPAAIGTQFQFLF